MLEPKKLTFSGIGRFIEEQSLDFTKLGNLVQIDGQNNNTGGGSSGSGKSTIIKALEFLLGLNNTPNTVLQSRLTKESILVTGYFDYNGLPLKIERGKKLLIDLNGQIITGSSKITEKKLDEIIGIPRDLFRKILIKRQNENGFFLDLPASDAHKFLTNCLGLQKEQQKIDILDKEIKDLEISENSSKLALEENKSALTATTSAIFSLGEVPISGVTQEIIDDLNNKVKNFSSGLKLAENVRDCAMDSFELSRPQINTIPFDHTQMEQIENEISLLRSEISQYEAAEFKRQSIVKENISNLKIEINKLNNLESIRVSQILNDISSTQLEISNLQKVEEKRKSEIQSKIASNRLEWTKNSNIVSQGDQAKLEAKGLAEDLKKLKSSVCPTCEQIWINDSIKNKEQELLLKLQDYKKLVIQGLESEAKLTSLCSNYNDLLIEANPKEIPEIIDYEQKIVQLTQDLKPKQNPQIGVLNKEIYKLEQESNPQVIKEVVELKLKIDFKNQELQKHREEEKQHRFKENTKSQLLIVEFNKKQTELRQTHDKIIKNLYEQVKNAENEYIGSVNKLNYHNESKKRYDESLHKLLKQKEKYEEYVFTYTNELKQIQEEKELALEAKKAIKSYLSCSFDDALDSISDTATRFIRNIPNMSTCTFQLEGLKETKDKIKEEINCLIHVDGEIGVPLKSLSGGERTACDIAIDLAVVSFIQETSGIGCNLIFLDEPFGGLDFECSSAALEIIKSSNLDKKVIIVDHNPQLKEMVTDKILVIRDGSISRVEQST